jgi:hypothetical protein
MVLYKQSRQSELIGRADRQSGKADGDRQNGKGRVGLAEQTNRPGRQKLIGRTGHAEQI